MEAFKKALLSQLEKSIDSFITQQTERVQEETNTHLSNFDTKMKGKKKNDERPEA